MMNYAKCKGCGNTIVWAETSHGKNVPLDPKAVVYSVRPENGKLIAVAITGHTGPSGDTIMVSHFNTCPKANDFSGSRRVAPPEPEKHFSEPQTAE